MLIPSNIMLIDLKHNLHKKVLAYIKIINIINDFIMVCHKSNHFYFWFDTNTTNILFAK
jgi:hypothetical protein